MPLISIAASFSALCVVPLGYVCCEMAAEESKNVSEVPVKLPWQRDLVLKLRDRLTESAELKVQVLELQKFIVWPNTNRKVITVGMLSSNVLLLGLCAPFVREWKNIVQIDVIHWVLLSVLREWKATGCQIE